MPQFSRRAVLGSVAVAALGGASGANTDDVAMALAAIHARCGGRLGVSALETGSGRQVGLDSDSRYALCSTFKVPLVAAVLMRVDQATLSLDDALHFTDADVLDYAPVVKQHCKDHVLTIAQACAGALEWSDNSAANLLLGKLGGPRAVTQYMRSLGDKVSRLDRIEPLLNRVPPGEICDTTTPNAMARMLDALVRGRSLSPASKTRLFDWMVACKTGTSKLRAGLPVEWRVGDKTGNSGDGKVNDIAICWPHGRSPIVIASYLDAPRLSADAASAIHAEVGRVVVRGFA